MEQAVNDWAVQMVSAFAEQHKDAMLYSTTGIHGCAALLRAVYEEAAAALDAKASELEESADYMKRHGWRTHCAGPAGAEDAERDYRRMAGTYRECALAMRSKESQAPSAIATLTARLEKAESELTAVRRALRRWQSHGCPDCGGDCASANPPVAHCIMQETRAALTTGGTDVQ